MKTSFHDYFSAVANRYADCRPTYPPSLFDYLATVVPRNATVWDCAAGNGQATRDLATRFDRVIATDASVEQLGAAPELPNVDYRVALAEEPGIETNSIGLVTVAQAIHWFDLHRFYAQVDRVLVAGGALAFWAYGILEVDDPEVDAITRHFYGTTLGPYWPRNRQLIEDGYRTLPLPYPELVPPPFVMEVNWSLDRLLGYFSTWSATSRYIEARGKNPLHNLTPLLEAAWGDPALGRRISWPLSVRICRKP